MTGFKLTYATMFNPPKELHAQFESSMEQLKANLGQEYSMLIGGKDISTSEKIEDRTPINHKVILALMPKGGEQHAQMALEAARAAFPAWSHTPWQERVRLLRKTADLIDERLTNLGAALCLEVGKNRMEALGDVAESAELIRHACDAMEANDGYVKTMGRDPLVGYEAHNVSMLHPYGVWLVISPFNFPFALTGGPAGAALAAGNTIVIKPATDTTFVVRLLVDCFRDAGFPEGVVNFVSGPGQTLGQALVDHPQVDGVTFTGSYAVGMKLFRDFANGRYVRPVILELGGKNPVIVSRDADLERATAGIIRSAFGLQGQKCSAASRIYIEAPVYDELLERLKTSTENLVIGDPSERAVFLGPVINQAAYQNFRQFSEELSQAGKILTGGQTLTNGEFANGYFCQPTLVTDLPLNHPLWKQEMFLPISTIARVENLESAIQYANDVDYGLTAGFYGSKAETEWFFDKIEAGVLYANRPQGATTGAWPGYQPFGGWKGSGSSGKNAGGFYYLPLYMHEQSRTVID